MLIQPEGDLVSLQQLQLRFATALFGDRGEADASWVVPAGLNPEARVAIYRNNLRVSFSKALALEFPVIQRLVGAEYFDHLATQFLIDHPSRCGNLQEIGAPFSGFLDRKFRQTEYGYLSHVAAVEWACEECSIAADDLPLDLHSLTAVSTEDYGTLHFALRAACRLIRTDYPVVRIWHLNQPECDASEDIDLGQGADLVLVRRAGPRIELSALRAGEFTLLEQLQGGTALDAAVDAAIDADPAFDLPAALRQCFCLALFSQISPSNTLSGELS